MTVVTPSSGTESHSLKKLHQHQALCRRQNLPLSLLGIQIRGLQPLKQEIGLGRFRRLQARITQLLQQQTRSEDTIIIWHQGHMLISLPGTPVKGAMVLAERLRQALSNNEFSVDDYCISLQSVMAIHCQADDQQDDSLQLVSHTLSLLASHNNDLHTCLSLRAQQQQSQPVPGLNRQLEALLSNTALNGEPNNQLLETLQPVLCRLSASNKMKLVNALLDASLHSQQGTESAVFG